MFEVEDMRQAFHWGGKSPTPQRKAPRYPSAFLGPGSHINSKLMKWLLNTSNVCKRCIFINVRLELCCVHASAANKKRPSKQKKSLFHGARLHSCICILHPVNTPELVNLDRRPLPPKNSHNARLMHHYPYTPPPIISMSKE